MYRRKKDDIGGQVLSKDYWEGIYILYDGNLMECHDSGNAVLFKVYNIKNGNVLFEGSMEYNEENTLSKLSEHLKGLSCSRIRSVICKEHETPDRHASIVRIMESRDPLAIWKVRALVKRILDKGIPGYGGKMGYPLMYEGTYGGFYLLDNGKIVEMEDLYEWDEESCDMIYDGMCQYYVYEAGSFLRRKARGYTWGYLKEERFSEMMEFIDMEHGKIVRKLVSSDEPSIEHFRKATEGDETSAKMVYTLTGVKVNNRP